MELLQVRSLGDPQFGERGAYHIPPHPHTTPTHHTKSHYQPIHRLLSALHLHLHLHLHVHLQLHLPPPPRRSVWRTKLVYLSLSNPRPTSTF